MAAIRGASESGTVPHKRVASSLASVAEKSVPSLLGAGPSARTAGPSAREIAVAPALLASISVGSSASAHSAVVREA